jgi:hypothetical protein
MLYTFGLSLLPAPPLAAPPLLSAPAPFVDVSVLLDPDVVIVTAPPVAAPVLRCAVAPPVLVLVPGVLLTPVISAASDGLGTAFLRPCRGLCGNAI